MASLWVLAWLQLALHSWVISMLRKPMTHWRWGVGWSAPDQAVITLFTGSCPAPACCPLAPPWHQHADKSCWELHYAGQKVLSNIITCNQQHQNCIHFEMLTPWKYFQSLKVQIFWQAKNEWWMWTFHFAFLHCDCQSVLSSDGLPPNYPRISLSLRPSSSNNLKWSTARHWDLLHDWTLS